MDDRLESSLAYFLIGEFADDAESPRVVEILRRAQAELVAPHQPEVVAAASAGE